MKVVETIVQARAAAGAARRAGKSIGLVPTMGALHEGHLSLVRASRGECGFTVVSIFVNPAQFGPGEDLSRYPRGLEADLEACRGSEADLVFVPRVEEMYHGENLTWVEVGRLGEHLCGASRPGHFRGVGTVVAKLFNIVEPDRAYFGQKDAQQLAIIERMVTDLNMNVEIRRCPTVRQKDGLALSSRNVYLSEEQRREALCLSRALGRAVELARKGERDCAALIEEMRRVIEAEAETRIDYISIVDRELLQPLARLDRPGLAALAVYVGQTRLIDNMALDGQERPS